MNSKSTISQAVSSATFSFTRIPGTFPKPPKARTKRLSYLKRHLAALEISFSAYKVAKTKVDQKIQKGNILDINYVHIERVRVEKSIEDPLDDYALMEKFQKEFSRGRTDRKVETIQKRSLETPRPLQSRFSRDFHVVQGPNDLAFLFAQGASIDTQGVTDWFARVAAIPESIGKGSEGIAGVAENMGRISAALGGVEDLPGAFETFSNAAKKFAEEGVRISHVPSLSPMQEGIVCLVMFCFFYRMDDPIAKGISYAAALYALYLISKHADQVPGLHAIFGICVGYLVARGGFKTEGPEIRAPLRLACSLLMLLSRYETYNIPPDANTFQKFMDISKFMQNCMSASVSDYSSVMSVVHLFQDLANTTAEAFGSNWRANFTGEYWVELDEMKEEYNVLREEFDERMEMASIARRVKTLLDRLDKVSIKKSNSYYHQHRDLRFAVNALYSELRGFGAYGNLERAEPLVVMLSGSAGIGKSIIYRLMQTVFAKRLLSPRAYVEYAKGKSGNVVWAPNLSESFDSGYSNQPILLCDDIGFSAESNKITIPKFISWVNQQPTQTNQAALERKGAVFFDSKVIIGTSNLRCFKPAVEGLTTPDAFYRRLHFCVYMELKPEFDDGNGRLDMSKIADHEKQKSGCWLNYFKFDPATGEKIPYEGDFGDLTAELVRLYDTRLSIHNMKVGNSNDFAQSLVALDINKPGVLKDVFKTQGPLNCPHYCCKHRTVSDELLRAAIFDEYTDDFKCYHCGKFFTDVLPDKYFDGGECFQDHSIDGVPLDMFCGYQSHLYIVCQHRKRQGKQQTLLSWILTSVSDFAQGVFKKLKEYFGKAWHVLVAGVAGLAAFGTYRKLFQEESPAEEEPTESMDTDPVISQARDQAVVDQGRKLIQSNIVWLVTEDDNQIGAGLALGADLILMNKHTLDAALVADFQEVHVLKFRSDLPHHRWKVPKTELESERNRYDFTDSDLCVVRIDKYSSPSIRNLFTPAKVEWTPARVRQVSMYFWELDSSLNSMPVNMHGPARGFRAISAVSPGGSKYVTSKTIEYDMPTYSGLCGAPVFINDNSLSAKLCGIHIAGHSNMQKGYAAVFTREMVDEVFSHFKPSIIKTNSNPMIREKVRHEETPEELIPDLIVAGVCRKKKAVYKTSLTRSPLFAKIYGVPVSKYPAILSPKVLDGRLVDPVVENIKGYSRGATMPDMEFFNGVKNAMIAHLKASTKPYNNVRPLSIQQAAMGDLNVVPNLAPLNRGTSCGFPDGEYFTDKKRGVFGGTDWVFTSSEYHYLHRCVEETLDHLEENPVDFIYSVFPKDELRPAAKVKSLSTRMIMSCSLTVAIVSRMYYGNMIDWFMAPSNRLKNFSAVGIDMSDASNLTEFIEFHGAGRPGIRVIAGDYKGFDKTLSTWVMEIIRFINQEFTYEYLNERDQSISDNIFISASAPFLQVGETLIKWTNSNPSGDVMTTPKNSLANACSLLYAIAKIVLGDRATEHEVYKFLTFSLKEGHVKITTFGDDLTLSLSEGIFKGYNYDLITNAKLRVALKELGLDYTDEEKRTEFNETRRTIFDVSFLKRRFRWSDEIGWVAYLDIETILQNIQWMKKDDSDLSVWHDKFENFLNELSVHPDEVWDEYYPKLRVAYENAVEDGPFSFAPSRLDRMKRWRSRPIIMGEFGQKEFPEAARPTEIALTDESMTQQAEGASQGALHNAARGDPRLAEDLVGGAEMQQVASGSEAEKLAVGPLVCQGVPQPLTKPWFIRQRSAFNTAVKHWMPNNDQNNLLMEGAQPPQSAAIHVEENAPVAERVSAHQLDPVLNATYGPNEISTVAEYLSKQTPVATFSWLTSSAVGALLVSQESWDYVNATTMWTEKLKGFYGLRATLCLRLELNGTPFHSGRLRLCYYPDASSSSEKWRSHLLSYISISQLPGVEIEANESSVVLRIPYVAVSRFIELTSTKRSWGRIFVAVASPLATGADGVQSVMCRLWTWMEDVELIGQTHKFITQGPKKRIAPSDEEGKPISSFFRNASKAVGSLSGIPAISAYTGPTAWALNALGGAASAFGWSKPSSQPSIGRVYNNPTGMLANFNGEEPVHALSLDADAKLRALDDAAPSGQDEMSINYIKTQWSYLESFEYTPTVSGVDPMYILDANPRNFLVAPSASLNYLTPLAYLASMFTAYRGGIEIKIKFAKTALHRGKVQLSYAPGPSPVTNTITESAYLYRTVFDLSEGGEICVTLPYLLPLDYIDTGIPFGRFYVHPITVLNRPETVSSTVVCSVYVRACPDMQFMQPKIPGYTPFNDPIVTQGPAEDLVNTGSIACDPIGGAPNPNMDIAFAESSASEVITSISQLLKRYIHIGLPFNGNPIFSFFPWANKGTFLAAGDPIETDYQAYVGSPFAFFRGGVRIKLTLNNGLLFESDAQKLSRIYAWLKPGTATEIFSMVPDVPAPTSDPKGYLAQSEAFGTATAMIVQVPYQGPWRMSPNRLYNAVGDAPGFDQPRCQLVASSPSGFGGVARAYADDFQFLFFVGIPNMAV